MSALISKQDQTQIFPKAEKINSHSIPLRANNVVIAGISENMRQKNLKSPKTTRQTVRISREKS